MCRSREKSGPLEVKVWSIVKWVMKLQICQKRCGVHPLELFTVGARLFQVLSFYHVYRGNRILMSQFGQNGRPLKVKNSPKVKWVMKLNFFQKWFRLHSLELFSTNGRLFQVKIVFSKKCHFYREGVVHMSESGENSRPLEEKVWPFVKWIMELKIFQKRCGVLSLGLFAADTRSFKVKIVFSTKLMIFLEKAQFMWVDLDRIVGH